MQGYDTYVLGMYFICAAVLLLAVLTAAVTFILRKEDSRNVWLARWGLQRLPAHRKNLARRCRELQPRSGAQFGISKQDCLAAEASHACCTPLFAVASQQVVLPCALLQQ